MMLTDSDAFSEFPCPSMEEVERLLAEIESADMEFPNQDYPRSPIGVWKPENKIKTSADRLSFGDAAALTVHHAREMCYCARDLPLGCALPTSSPNAQERRGFQQAKKWRRYPRSRDYELGIPDALV